MPPGCGHRECWDSADPGKMGETVIFEGLHRQYQASPDPPASTPLHVQRLSHQLALAPQLSCLGRWVGPQQALTLSQTPNCPSW